MKEQLDNLAKTLAAYNAAREQLSKITKEQIADLFRPFFEANPDVEALRWSQYTPYFMDGDPCVFGVNELMLVSEKLFSEPGEYLEAGIRSEYDAEKELRPMFAEAARIRDALPNELLQDIFGDHVSVTINRNGTIEVDDCQHD